MSYGSWGNVKERESRGFFEKAYRREPLPAWDVKWDALSVRARTAFLRTVKGPVKSQSPHSPQPAVARDKFPAGVLDELVSGGFVEIQPARSRALPDRVVACEAIYDFATRIRSLNRLHLLDEGRPSEFEKYVDYAFYSYGLPSVLFGVLNKVGIEDYLGVDSLLTRYVTHRRWPAWVVQSLNTPLARQVLDVFVAADGPIPLADLTARLKGADRDAVRSVVDTLVTHLALVEDLDPKTSALVVGFLPSVREDLERNRRPRERPPLIAIERPREVGPDGGVVVDDLRAVLLELASEPARLRQDHSLFQKEIGRFNASVGPQPAWFLQVLKWTEDARLDQALGWARALELVVEKVEGKELRLHLNSKGNTWLSGDLDRQYASVYGLIARPADRNERYDPHYKFFFPGLDPFSSDGAGDTRFLAEPVTVLKAVKGKGPRSLAYWNVKPADHEALRKSLDGAFASMEPGVFYRLDGVESHLAFGTHNPLNLGLPPDQVAVYWSNRPVPALEEQREEAALLLLDGFIRRRLIPLGCVRAALDDEGRVCVSREPLFDGLFGRKVARSEASASVSDEARVVVQPDFSVIVIGLNPTPVAELAPFCERASHGGGQGAMILKLTRDSVVKAVSQGLKPSEIVARLNRHASTQIPANVLREVQGWSQWAREVTLTTLTVLRCPDRETADRIMGAMKKQAERLSDRLVAVDQKRLTAADRNKLRTHGVIVRGRGDTEGKTPKTRKAW